MIFTETGGLLMITLYSTGCPKCKVLKRKLEDLSIDFRVLYDMDRLLELGFMEVPVL
jgi:glutaredoxin